MAFSGSQTTDPVLTKPVLQPLEQASPNLQSNIQFHIQI